MKNLLRWLVTFVILCIITFAIVAWGIWLISLCFGFCFSWRFAFGVWIMGFLIYVFVGYIVADLRNQIKNEGDWL